MSRGTKPEVCKEDVEETYREKHEVEKDEEGHSEVRSSGHATTAVICTTTKKKKKKQSGKGWLVKGRLLLPLDCIQQRRDTLMIG